MRNTQFSDPGTLLAIILFTLFGCIVISFPLWLNERFLAVVPIVEHVAYTGWRHWILLMIWGVFFVFIAFHSAFRGLALMGFLVISVLLALQDQMRWQPWFYQLECMLLFYALYHYKLIHGKQLCNIYRIILIGMYVWAGIHKFNAGFVEDVLPDILAADPGMPGYAVPVIEVLLGLGLLFNRTRNISVSGILATHLLIVVLIALGILAYDLVILPWNIGLMIMVYLLFWQKKGLEIFNPGGIPLLKGTVAGLFLVLPGLYFANLWDGYPSFTLFSGKTDKGYIHVTESFKQQFAETVVPQFNVLNKLGFQEWSYAVLRVPAYPEERVFLSVFRSLCEQAPHELDVILEIRQMPDLFEKYSYKQTYFCSEVEAGVSAGK